MTSVTLQYSADDLLSFSDTIIKIDAGKWFKLIYDSQVGDGPRLLDFYPDFQGDDQFSCLIEFNKPITVHNECGTFEVGNNYAHVIYSITQTGENSVLVNCKYSTLALKVEAVDIEWVQEINTFISYINDQQLIVSASE